MKINYLTITEDNDPFGLDFFKRNTNQDQSGLIITNDSNKENIGIYYFKFFDNDKTLIYVNWLNWIHKISSSLDGSYNIIKNVNDNYKDHLIHKSDIHCFIGLYPLLMHLPNNYIGNISTMSFYDIFRIFCNRKDNEYISKDYSRNIYSRLKTSINEEFNLKNMTIFDLMKSSEFINIKNDEDILLKKTKIKNNIIINDYKDKTLEIILDQYYSFNKNN
jgi:hypothetical protein